MINLFCTLLFYFYSFYLLLGAVHKCQHLHKRTNHTLSGETGGVCENQHFFYTLLTFRPDFHYFHGDIWDSKNVDVYSFLGEEGISESVWFVHS